MRATHPPMSPYCRARVNSFHLAVYADFAIDQDLSEAHAVVWWADLTTGPQGQDMTVEDRLAEICRRYGPDDLITRFIRRARPVLVAAGQSPYRSIQVRC